MSGSQYSAISLYSGAGGLDLGFQQAGFKLLWANDADAWACETYKANIGDHITCADVLGLKPPADLRPDVVIGGPPCQGFSVIGLMDRADPRSQHVFHFLDIVADLGPRAFVMENVKALAASPRWRQIRDRLVSRAERIGYSTRIFVLNAADFGVPQARERMFMIGSADGEPLAPKGITAGRPRSVREALATLPPFGEPGNDSMCRARVMPAAKPVMRPTAYRGSLLFNGSGRPLQLDAPAKTLPASMGGNATPIVDQEELAQGAEPWVVEYHRHLMEGGRPLRVAPTRMRRITVEEAAALQTFPRGYAFHGRRVAQYRQIGNAVPPELARNVARAVHASLSCGDAASGLPIAA